MHDENPFFEPDIWKKIEIIKSLCHKLLVINEKLEIPLVPARTPKILEPILMPVKKGLSHIEGRAHRLHDLASIELQAAELGIRTLIEFPCASPEFRNKLAEIVLEELQHLNLCLESLDLLGYQWGDRPVQVKLWLSTSSSDNFLDRIFIVHNYLEGAGLDASTTLLKKLNGVECRHLKSTVNKIAKDEEGHVEFGTKWFKETCLDENLDPDQEFKERLHHLSPRLPRRVERINIELRKCLGFSEDQLKTLTDFRSARLGQEVPPVLL